MKSIRLAITAICLILSPHTIVAGPAWEPIVPFGIIKGVVRDTSGQTIPYVRISISGQTVGAMSDRNGVFVIYFVPPGVHTVRSMMMGYHEAWTDSVVVDMGRETEVKIEMKEKPSLNTGWTEGKKAP